MLYGKRAHGRNAKRARSRRNLCGNNEDYSRDNLPVPRVSIVSNERYFVKRNRRRGKNSDVGKYRLRHPRGNRCGNTERFTSVTPSGFISRILRDILPRKYTFKYMCALSRSTKTNNEMQCIYERSIFIAFTIFGRTHV